MNRSMRGFGVALCAAAVLGTLTIACGDDGAAASDLTVERLPDVRPNLPEVPTLPPPPHPIQYPDNSYSVYGLRHRMRNTIDSDVEVTGYIVEIYEPPECPEGERCPVPAAPHMWIADTQNETDAGKRLMVVGYAENQAQIDEAIEDAERGRAEELTEEQIAMGMRPIPTDFHVGNKVKVQGRFVRISGAGFNSSEGLLDYAGHETLENVAGDEDDS